ncbi:hypothetical protein [Ehrlichia muris]|uniref:Uncharacterized protein n=2 Tax=Ehrlichia muris TaxID=35795 RepID=A0A0F3NDA3_9RICK|nr:hypothetical protein [Ehrlichia muris]KJV65682.1 hypothetical protein EMUCRT_0633 [Ehrlichia cf. muris str. EmCRT]
MLQISERNLQGSPQIELPNSSQEIQLSDIDKRVSVDPYELGLLLAGFFSAMNSFSYSCSQYHHCYYYDCCYDPSCYFDYTASDCCVRPKMQDNLLQEYSES